MTPALREAVALVRHDLGKYVCFEQRWANPADAASLRQALLADVATTRRSAAGARSAPELWAALRPRLASAGATPEQLAPLDEAVAVLASALPSLVDGTLTDDALPALAAAARSVADQLDALHRAARSP